ncbi:hypothetical protein LZ554_008061 [Drepanopeziza brunnea f. sp. 'monogermtubi']|nr:hypothetical protein LZ554_008061 [Drepanopeziza brunnea f. sp. 'monogermtubi']
MHLFGYHSLERKGELLIELTEVLFDQNVKILNITHLQSKHSAHPQGMEFSNRRQTSVEYKAPIAPYRKHNLL